MNNNDFETELKREYNLRLERRQEYIQKYKPSEEVEFLTEELLKQDYYYALLLYASHIQDETGKELERYHALLPEINGLYHKGILSARLFDIAESVENYVLFGMALKNRRYPKIEDMMSLIGENTLNQYLYTKMMANCLTANDTLALAKRHAQFDSIVKMPHLRAQITQIYNRLSHIWKILNRFPIIYCMGYFMKMQVKKRLCHLWNLFMKCSRKIVEK